METITADQTLARAGFYWRTRDGVRALVCAPLEQVGFVNAFSTRVGGVSPFPADALNLAGFSEDTAANIHENRRRFFQLLPGAWTLAAAWQVHGADTCVVRDTEDARRSEQQHCDALTTNAPAILVGVKTADCIPILLGDARHRASAAVHAGWRGTAQTIVGHALERMRAEYGTQPEDVHVAIGPAALQCCYEIGREVIETFRANFPAADELLIPTRPDHARIDLHTANRQQLINAGVPAAQIHTAPLCTICRPDLFFSYRREKKLYGRTGRLLAVIGRGQRLEVRGQ
ncbi:MAG: peptidoglycan editing factor PgeF [Pyrinomonadaceae bacterium]